LTFNIYLLYILYMYNKNKTVKVMKALHDETIFVGGIGLWLSGGLPDQKEIEELFDLVKGCNRYMERTIKAIRKGRVSLNGFTSQDKEIFSKLFDSEKLNKELGRQLKEEIEKGMSKSNDKWIPKLNEMCDRFIRSHFLIKNRKLKVNHYKESEFYWKFLSLCERNSI